MPSTLLGNPVLSGAQIILSGDPWTGQKAMPQGGIQLRLDKNSSGNVYIGYSGGITVTSGGMFLSGGGLLDGMPLYPGDAMWVPRIATGVSGTFAVYARHDVACSGQGRLYFEVF